MDDRSKAKLASNEKVFREANERVEKRLQQVFDPDDKVSFVCECSNTDCTGRIDLTVREFEVLHASSRLFIIMPRHETVEVEKVISKMDNYWIVEKFVEPT